MSLLAKVRAKSRFGHAATATVATVATVQANLPQTQAQLVSCVAKVATVAVAKPGNQEARLDAADPNRWCWPNSSAMTTREIDSLIARQGRFIDKGVSLGEAEQLADKLVIRDREADDRRLCLECAHLQGTGPWRCGKWQTAVVARAGIARDLVLMLQRCCSFFGRP